MLLRQTRHSKPHFAPSPCRIWIGNVTVSQIIQNTNWIWTETWHWPEHFKTISIPSADLQHNLIWYLCWAETSLIVLLWSNNLIYSGWSLEPLCSRTIIRIMLFFLSTAILEKIQINTICLTNIELYLRYETDKLRYDNSLYNVSKRHITFAHFTKLLTYAFRARTQPSCLLPLTQFLSLLLIVYAHTTLCSVFFSVCGSVCILLLLFACVVGLVTPRRRRRR